MNLTCGLVRRWLAFACLACLGVPGGLHLCAYGRMRRLYHHTGGWTPRYRIPILMVPRSFLAVAILQAVAAQVPANDQLDTPVAVARPEAEPTSSIVGGVEISPSYKYPFLVSCLLCSRSLSRKQYDVQPVLPCLVSHSEHLLPAGELAILVLAARTRAEAPSSRPRGS